MSLALAPLGLLYGAAVRTRLGLYRSGLLKTQTVGAPVVSVGNITAGGTGKTPLVEWVARSLARDGLNVCVLTRGYGRADESRRVVASDGGRVLAGVEECGDEPRLLAERLVGAASVVCDRDRASAARWARENLGADVFVLDDGFQHLRIARRLDIVAVDASAPWGGGRLLPRGRLREPRGGLARAGCVVITRSDMAEDLGALRDEVLRLSGGKAAVIASRVRTLGLSPADAASSVSRIEFESDAGTDLPEGGGGKALLERVAAQPVGAFCAVGNPRAFFAQLRRDGFDLRHERAFADHHKFTQAELDDVAREAGRAGARALLTTAKDAVKLRTLTTSLPFYVVEIGLEFEDEGKLLGLVREAARRA
ncbi:MAG TPA: tetraacyldisaccharide 4'-kinase [Pyrinomonadaceae bacterium]|jgi:tetraacyldisaccharide 4'-kinase|nr:tetraacyldisaccharide 4'-kinase [Pyrinomonadaceae bacterium]